MVVAVGASGRIFNSSDGVTWTPRESGTTDLLLAVTHAETPNGGLFVAVGEHGRILKSPDGLTWQPASPAATAARLNNVAHGGGRWVAVGEQGTVLVSTDAESWQAVRTNTTRWLRGLAHFAAVPWVSEGYFVATGEAGTALRVLADGRVQSLAVDSALAPSDLEVMTYSSERHHYITAYGPLFYENFLVFGQAGATGILSVNELQQNGPVLRSTTHPVPTQSRIRAATISGTHRFAGDLVRSGVLDSYYVSARATLVIDEDGRAFSLPTSGSWGAEPRLPQPGIHGVAYARHLDAYFAVGDGESIFELHGEYAGRLANVSARAFVPGRSRPVISGFVVGGTVAKNVLLRGIGPALAAFGVAAPLGSATLEIYADSRRIASNSGWQAAPNARAIREASERIGAFSLPENGADAAVLLSLSPGAYTAMLTGTDDAAGVGLIELYDADVVQQGIARATNLSTRGHVGPDEQALIAGFVVEGIVTRKLLIRAIGPTLASFGLEGVLEDPVLALSDAVRRDLASSDNWADAPEFKRCSTCASGFAPGGVEAGSRATAADFAAAGAFALESGSQDAALVVSLRPGHYTVVVTGRNGGSGTALVEVYDITP